MSKILRKVNGYGSLLKIIVEVIVVVIFAWTYMEVRDAPKTFATKAELRIIKKEIREDMERLISPMRSQIGQIFTHLLGHDSDGG